MFFLSIKMNEEATLMASRLRKLQKLSERPPVHISADMIWKKRGLFGARRRLDLFTRVTAGAQGHSVHTIV
jgi:hypothetical protein